MRKREKRKERRERGEGWRKGGGARGVDEEREKGGERRERAGS